MSSWVSWQVSWMTKGESNSPLYTTSNPSMKSRFCLRIFSNWRYSSTNESKGVRAWLGDPLLLRISLKLIAKLWPILSIPLNYTVLSKFPCEVKILGCLSRPKLGILRNRFCGWFESLTFDLFWKNVSTDFSSAFTVSLEVFFPKLSNSLPSFVIAPRYPSNPFVS